MSDHKKTISATNTSSRREFIKNTGRVAAATAIVGAATSAVHAGEDNTIRVALIGCGGRGTGATTDAFSVPGESLKLVAVADVFDTRVSNSLRLLKQRYPKQVDVPKERQFFGFDAYKQAIDCLRPGDIVIFATPPAFRWVHFTYAIEKGINVFMEKPVSVDGPTTRRMIHLAKEAEKKNLKVGVGLMVRHCRGRRELYDRIRDGQIGQIIALRGYRMSGVFDFTTTKPKDKTDDLMYQVKQFHAFLWASGGMFSDFCIHQIDECCWMKDDWPVKAEASGGRHYRNGSQDQNLDSYAVEYTFRDGTSFFYTARTMSGCLGRFASYAEGTKGSAVISNSGHYPGKVRIYNSHRKSKKNLTWAYPQPEARPYLLEWIDLVDAIRNDKPYNEVERGAIASMVTSMGRMAAHTGQSITYDEMLNCEHEFAPGLDKLTADSPAPLQSNADGNMPLPMPGLITRREY